MYTDFFVNSPLLALPIASLVVFIVAFAAIVVRTLRHERVSTDSAARIPLEGEVDHG